MVNLMKKIPNEHFVKFRDVIKRSLFDDSVFDDCFSDMISASEDTHNHIKVYDFPDCNMEAIKLDEYTKDFDQKRRNEMPELRVNHQPFAVDAICINKDNEWFLIEFKNQPYTKAVSDSKKKMLSSLWLIGYLYSKLSEKIADDTDFLKFAREKVTYITVVSSDKNEDDLETLGVTWEKDGAFYTSDEFTKYKGYYFKDIYLLTDLALRFFIELFD